MLDSGMAITKMSNDKSKEDYATCNNFNKKYFVAWSPMDQNKSLVKHRYVMCSRSAPHASKHLTRCRIRRSTTFDGNFHYSSNDSSSFEEDKHLSRSAKIMRALNFNSSPTYYGKTKIKKSLNFNSTPSPKRFTPVRKTIRKSLSLNFTSPLSASHKLNFSDKSSDSINSSYLFPSSESIDENQNEAPSQENAKEHEMLHYSTPNAKLARNLVQSPSCTPLLRTRLKDMITSIVTATPTSVSLAPKDTKCSNMSVNTSRNLYNEFYDDDNDRPTTPENVVHIVAESMSAIKRSHKKERLRRSGRCTTLCMNNFVNDDVVLRNRSNSLSNQHADLLQESKTNVEPYISKNFELELTHCEDDISETGSLFDYTKEQENIVQEFKNVSDSVLDYANVPLETYKTNVKVKSEENIQILDESQSVQDYNSPDTKNLANNNIDATVNVRAVTPEPTTETALNTQITVTPENRLLKIATDSIKKSHKKVKEDKRKYFTPKVLILEGAQKQQNIKYLQNIEYENIEENKISIEENSFDVWKEKRSSTPEEVNSSRLLLAQFSSVKKSHKKDKHNKIVSEFLKRQEYFNRDMDLATTSTYKPISVDTFNCKTEDSSSDLGVTNIGDVSDMNTSCDSELQELHSSKEDFQIFSPLKRKKFRFTAPKKYSHPYDLSGKNESSKNDVAEINYSRCLTPVLNIYSSNSLKVEVNNVMEVKSDPSCFMPISNGADEVHNFDSNDTTGRLTPRNMSTTELYSNLDSIKKSHKKNKRGNMKQKNLNFVVNNRNNKSSIEEDIDSKVFNFSNDCIATNEITNKSIDCNDTEASRSFVSDNENCPSTSAENILSTVTPPNCLKTKSYMRLIENTSIKQSHKKIRNKKRRELAVEENEVSDTGSIFDDEE